MKTEKYTWWAVLVLLLVVSPTERLSFAWLDETHLAIAKMDGIVNDEVLDNLGKIEVYPIEIKTEQDLIREIARIANLSLVLGYKLEDAGRLLTREETYQQLSHSASLMKAVLIYLEK
jgi:hypothetical protein